MKVAATFLNSLIIERPFCEKVGTFGQHFFFFLYIQFTLFQTKIYSHQVLIYLNVPGIPVRKPLQNRQIVEERLDVLVLEVICASLLTGRKQSIY